MYFFTLKWQLKCCIFIPKHQASLPSNLKHCFAFPLFFSGINKTPSQIEKLTPWPFDKTIIFHFNKAKASPSKTENPIKKMWIPHLIHKNRVRLRDEFLLTHCWEEMFDLQHYVQSGGRLFMFLPKRRTKSIVKMFHMIHFLKLNRSTAISPNNYEQSSILDCTSSPANQRCVSKQWKAPCGNWLSSFSSFTIFQKKKRKKQEKSADQSSQLSTPPVNVLSFTKEARCFWSH